MSKLLEIKGLLGWHLHIIVEWRTVQANMQHFQGLQERIIPLMGIELMLGAKGGYTLSYGCSSFGMEKEQYEHLKKILSEQHTTTAMLLERDYRSGPPNSREMVAPTSDPSCGIDCINRRLEAA